MEESPWADGKCFPWSRRLNPRGTWAHMEQLCNSSHPGRGLPRLCPCFECTGVHWGAAKMYEGPRHAFGMPKFNTRVRPGYRLDVARRAAVGGWDSRASLTGVIKHWPLHWMETKLANSWAPTLDILLDPAGLSWPTRCLH